MAVPATTAGRASGRPTRRKTPPAAERPPHLERADRLLAEGGAGQQIDVGVERHGQHEGGRADGADLREPVVARVAPAEERAHAGLHGARVLEHVDQRIGADIGRHRERREQRPFEPAPAGKLRHRDQPGGARADSGSARSHHQHQRDRVAEVDRQRVADEVRPHVLGREERDPGDGGYGHQQQRRQHQRADRPEVGPRDAPGCRRVRHGRPDSGLPRTCLGSESGVASCRSRCAAQERYQRRARLVPLRCGGGGASGDAAARVATAGTGGGRSAGCARPAPCGG